MLAPFVLCDRPKQKRFPLCMMFGAGWLCCASFCLLCFLLIGLCCLGGCCPSVGVLVLLYRVGVCVHGVFQRLHDGKI